MKKLFLLVVLALFTTIICNAQTTTYICSTKSIQKVSTGNRSSAKTDNSTFIVDKKTILSLTKKMDCLVQPKYIELLIENLTVKEVEVMLQFTMEITIISL
jgi:hypothetical protein